MAESSNQNKKEDDKKEKEKPALASSLKKPGNEIKKNKSLRFMLPSTKAPSEESFTSAVSKESDDSDSEVYEDFVLKPQENVLALKKYIFTPLKHSSPRQASMKPCFRNLGEEDFGNFESTSTSKPLFEVLRHSPTPSNADINLINATYLRKLADVKQAIKSGADVNTFRDRQTPLLIAAEIGDARLVAYLLTHPQINPNFRNDFGQTPLMVAVRNAFDKIVKLLLSHHADVNIGDNMGTTPLHSALFQRRPSLAKLLLAYGADYDKADCFGEKPMYTSVVKKPHLECLLTMLKIGASPEYCNITRIPLLSRAILNGTELKILEALVKYGASTNSRDLTSGKTPLHFVAMTNNVLQAMFLVKEGALLNLKTSYGFTPLDEAIFHGNIQVAEYLSEVTPKTQIRPQPTVTKDKQQPGPSHISRKNNFKTK